MNQNPHPDQTDSGALTEWVADAQHDLRNPLGNILGFCEILLKQVQPLLNQELRRGFDAIYQSAEQMVKEIDQVLDPNKTPAGRDAVAALQVQLRQQAAQIISTLQNLAPHAAALGDDLFSQDFSRMSESAARLGRMIEKALSSYPDR